MLEVINKMEFLKIIFMLFILPILLLVLIYMLIDWLITFLPAEVIFGLITTLSGGVLYYFYKKEVE